MPQSAAHRTVRVANETRGLDLAMAAEVADTWRSRLVGLLGRHGLEDGGGLIIEPCSSVHCLGMRFTIDVLFCDRDGTVLYAKTLRPQRFSPMVRRARRAIELPEGTIRRTGTVTGDRIVLTSAP